VCGCERERESMCVCACAHTHMCVCERERDTHTHTLHDCVYAFLFGLVMFIFGLKKCTIFKLYHIFCTVITTMYT
jgi:hypothetical protein